MIRDALALIGAYAVGCWLRDIYVLLTSDRTGNSGRYKHWEEDDD